MSIAPPKLTVPASSDYKSAAMLDALLQRRLVFVTGKGGVGRTAVTVALGVAAARGGRRVLIVELDPYGRIGEYLGAGTLGAEPAEIEPHLSVAAIASATVMEEFLVGVLRLRALARRLLQSDTFRVVTAAAPGLQDFLTLVRVLEWEEARPGLRRRRPRFDLVLVDAPATGHSVPLLATPGSLLKLLPFGPLASRARHLAWAIGDASRTAALVVTRPEAMAVNETLELATALMELGLAMTPPVVNAVAPERFTQAERRRLTSEPPDVPAALAPYVAAGRFGVARQRAAERQIHRLARTLGQTPVRLPQVPAASFGRPAIEQLADVLAGGRRTRRRAS